MHVDAGSLGLAHFVVSRDQRCFKRLGEDDVGGIVRGEVVAQSKNVIQQVGHLMPLDMQRREITYCVVESRLIQLVTKAMPTKSTGDLKVQQGRCVQLLIGQPREERWVGRIADEGIDDR